jgi:hypothetical protein
VKLLRQRPARLTGPPNPYQTAILLAALISGFAFGTGCRPPNSIEQALPEWLRMTWAWMLFFGAVMAFAGLYWPGSPFTAVEVKRAGHLLIAGGTLAYGLTVGTVFGAGALWQIVWNLLIGAAALIRAVQVTVILRAARAHAVEFDTVRRRRGGGRA